ncbi:hypothetical protein DDF62_02680 [Caulobacter radicis]|uniref:hypothetical protein n=1 Tax=Caulobacter radicis TaxID=2172650 RepID=UPI000D5862BE|nr:hypothetical protein [Caulobacter radicis]PVM92077.1 hypothetical protein DDF62_02680 [Caulobacter radicis]
MGLDQTRSLAPYTSVMAEKSEHEARRWGERLQGDLMASMDAEWDRAKDSDDVAVVALADKRARMFGTFARSAKAVVAMISEPKQAAGNGGEEDEADMHGEIPDDPEELRAAVESKVAKLAELLERKRRDGAGGDDRCDEPGAAAEISQRRSG